MIRKAMAICMLGMALLGCGGREAAKPTAAPQSAPVVLEAVPTVAAATPAPTAADAPNMDAALPAQTPVAAEPAQTPVAAEPARTVDAITADGLAVTEENAAVTSTAAGMAPLNVSAGGSIQLIGGAVAASDASVPCMRVSGDAAVSLSAVAQTGAFARLAEIDGGELTLTAARQALTGDILLRNGATVSMRLTEASTFTGTFVSEGEGETAAHITLSADSVWSVTGETSVGILVNADAKMTNIRSNGFTVYYNAELAENAYLKGGGFLLDGGGFLTPMI